MKRREFLQVLGAGCWGSGVGAPVLRPRDDIFVERWSWAMGQAVHVMVFARSEPEGLDACAAALAELRRIEARLTLFDPASELCELNRRAGRKDLRVDADLRAVLAPANGVQARRGRRVRRRRGATDARLGVPRTAYASADGRRAAGGPRGGGGGGGGDRRGPGPAAERPHRSEARRGGR